MSKREETQPEDISFPKLAETIPTAIIKVNKDGRIVYANKKAQEVLGLEESEITNRTYDDVDWKFTYYDGTDYPSEELPFEIVKETEEPVQKIRHAIEWPGGERKLLSINASPLFDDDGNFDGIVSAIEDATNQVRAKKALQGSKGRYQELFEESPIGLWEEDFSLVKKKLDQLKSDGVEDIREYLDENNDFVREMMKAVDIISANRAVLDTYEAELEKSESKFRGIAEQAHDGLFIFRGDKLEWLNERVSEILGYSEEDLYQKNIWNLIHPEDRDRVKEIHRKGVEGIEAPPTYEARLVRKGGEVRNCEFSVTRIEYSGEQAFLGAVRDITERKKAEEELRKSEQKFRSYVENAPLGVFIVDENGNYVEVNEAACELTGYTEEELLGMGITDIRSPEAKGSAMENFKKLLRDGEMQIETPYVKKDGAKGHMVIKAVKISENRYLGFTLDVTPRKRAESKVKKERDRAQRYLDIAGSIIVLLDEDRNIEEINQKGCQILGYNREEIIGKNMYENFVPDRIRDEVIKDTREPIMEGKLEKTKHYENPILTREGEERIIAWVNSPVKKAGEVVGTLSSGIDITERKRMEEQIQKDRTELRHSFVELAETTSRVLGVRDPYTKRHEQRVGEIAREVGKRMRLDEDTLLGLYLGGVLHDIGKIVVPETILTKPGDLKNVEWRMIKSHPKVGYNQILVDTDFPWPVAEMTLHHHERLDGSGYPDGLTGEGISKEVRVLAAVDVVEAMSTRRPYREARSKERTLNVIKEGKGGKFDPKVVDVLVEMIKEGKIQFGE